jgi:ATPase family AAA domain-containing protein 1
MVDTMSPEKKEEVKTKQLEALKRLGHTGLKLDEYERMHLSLHHLSYTLTLSILPGTVANEVIHPDDINVRFAGTCPFTFQPINATFL